MLDDCAVADDVNVSRVAPEDGTVERPTRLAPAIFSPAFTGVVGPKEPPIHVVLKTLGDECADECRRECLELDELIIATVAEVVALRPRGAAVVGPVHTARVRE